MFLNLLSGGPEFRLEGLPFRLPAWPAALQGVTRIVTTRMRTRRPSIVQPRWTMLIRDICAQSKLDREKLPWANATPAESGTGRHESEFSLAEHRSIQRMDRRVNGTMRDPQQHDDSDRKQEPPQPSLHRDSASRARSRFRSLFSSASSRKHSCSFCQAATPSRVASYAAFGT